MFVLVKYSTKTTLAFRRRYAFYLHVCSKYKIYLFLRRCEFFVSLSILLYTYTNTNFITSHQTHIFLYTSIKSPKLSFAISITVKSVAGKSLMVLTVAMVVALMFGVCWFLFYNILLRNLSTRYNISMVSVRHRFQILLFVQNPNISQSIHVSWIVIDCTLMD